MDYNSIIKGLDNSKLRIVETTTISDTQEHETQESIDEKLKFNGFILSDINNILTYTLVNIKITLDWKDSILILSKNDEEIVRIHNKTKLSESKYIQYPPTKYQFAGIMIYIREEKFKNALK